MTQSIFRLVYMSECVLPVDPEAYKQSINDLLVTSRDWNKDHDITGSLLFSTGYFAQVLEGPVAEVKHLIGQIICDQRHRGLRLIEQGLVPARLFGNWAMAYTDGDEQFDLLMTVVLDTPAKASGPGILSMLRHLITPDRGQVFSPPQVFEQSDMFALPATSQGI